MTCGLPKESFALLADLRKGGHERWKLELFVTVADIRAGKVIEHWDSSFFVYGSFEQAKNTARQLPREIRNIPAGYHCYGTTLVSHRPKKLNIRERLWEYIKYFDSVRPYGWKGICFVDHDSHPKENFREILSIP